MHENILQNATQSPISLHPKVRKGGRDSNTQNDVLYDFVGTGLLDGFELVVHL